MLLRLRAIPPLAHFPPKIKHWLTASEHEVGAGAISCFPRLGAMAQRSARLLQQHVQITHGFFDLRWCWLTWFVGADACMPGLCSPARDQRQSQFPHHLAAIAKQIRDDQPRHKQPRKVPFLSPLVEHGFPQTLPSF